MSATRAIFPLAVVFVALAATVAAALHFADYGTDPPNSDEWFAGTNRPADITAPVRKIYPIPSAVAYGREIAAATVLVPAASLDKRLVPECSGLAASQKYPGVFWAHSDSDTAHRFNTLVPIYADGRTVRPPVAASPKNGGPQQAREQWRGIVVAGARNNDWEAITTDGRGNLILGDIGNNTNRRRDLGLLIFPEPNPRAATTAAPRRIAVRHAAQTEFPDPKKRFDCESLFVWGGAVHTFTKRRSDTWTVLCKLRMESATAGVFEPVAAFDSNGMVTDAAVSPDGRRLAVLTYHCLWMFELPAAGAGTAATTAAPQNPLAGGAVWYRRLKFPADNWQAEGLAFSDARHVLIATEQGGLFTLDTATMTQVAGKK